jgi:hypothetical protein
MTIPSFALCLAAAGLLSAAEKYTGPRPPKPDIPYLLHANNLVPSEVGEAREENRKNETVYIIAGASSPASTPLAEPIFLMEAQKISPERMEMYRLEVRNGNREVSISQKRRKGSARPIHVAVTRLSDNLYRIEANDPLENGEYSLSPSDSNRVFCFQIY